MNPPAPSFDALVNRLVQFVQERPHNPGCAHTTPVNGIMLNPPPPCNCGKVMRDSKSAGIGAALNRIWSEKGIDVVAAAPAPPPAPASAEPVTLVAPAFVPTPAEVHIGQGEGLAQVAAVAGAVASGPPKLGDPDSITFHQNKKVTVLDKNGIKLERYSTGSHAEAVAKLKADGFDPAKIAAHGKYVG
jgi:hypothetical protein